MKTIYILHYHLNPGGVTRIIESQVRGLKAARPDINIVILAGHDSGHLSLSRDAAEIRIIDGLNYLADDVPGEQQRSMLESLSTALSHTVRKDDILHVHNLNLGKNPLLTLAVVQLAGRGLAIVNHCHDFAEDRPANMRFLEAVIARFTPTPISHIFYPDARRMVFIALNSADAARLVDLGADRTKVFHLPNPVNTPINILAKEEAQKRIRTSLGLQKNKLIITFPVRVIRRKNVGEFILLAQLFHKKAHWLITQPPKNPVEIKPYQKWKEFCREHEIDIHFEVGEKVDFETLMIASDSCVTTSVQEGFGMAFLEPWSYTTPVFGRDIPSVTTDLKNSGLQLPHLYKSLNVVCTDGICDFGALPMAEQMDFIKAVKSDTAKSESVLQMNPLLTRALHSFSAKIVEHNKNIVKDNYSITAYGKRLFEIYDSIAARA